jgi:hypothetical protein
MAQQQPTWWWADDKDGGHQNHWVQYDAPKSAVLETAFQAKQARVDVDGVRFVQINRVNMYQELEREARKGSAAGTAAAAVGAAATQEEKLLGAVTAARCAKLRN